ncbi:class I SAM-dependent methyltransferase [Halorussus sp. MSC15.2]|uniref:class I SAM-dependent methyltransferase n=1 Tax=Halorussus sp. MSC15.2 TaxID=2283638 RepID=UPI0013D234A6|nr:class I SAM-dependent methyltransferase [Halorussus sp. MSC15.2]NEU56317.1 class I SAM-dependent methyltransferase [Halorussus sp. MSC15.2]
MTDMDPRRYYDEFGEGEWERLDANPVTRLEFETTTDYLAEHLPDPEERSDSDQTTEPVRVLDAGGGAGRYALWLAERGHEVTLADISAEQVAIAREKAAERGVGQRVATEQADLRDLPFESEQFDAVCCLGGPLSHVVDAEERERAIRELRRVARPGAPVFVSVIGRLSSVRYGMKHGERFGLLKHIAETGDYTEAAVEELADGEGWAECHFFRADEFECELEDGGLTVERLVGLEGPASQLQEELSDVGEEGMDEVREIVAQLREDRSVVDTSEHMLAVCRA